MVSFRKFFSGGFTMPTTRDDYRAKVEKVIEETCKKGNHKLNEIYRFGSVMDSHVVRWCKTCGSVVVDIDYDDRTNPGAIMKMKSPSISKGLS